MKKLIKPRNWNSKSNLVTALCEGDTTCGDKGECYSECPNLCTNECPTQGNCDCKNEITCDCNEDCTTKCDCDGGNKSFSDLEGDDILF